MINLPQTNTITNVYRAHLPTNGARTHNPSDDLDIKLPIPILPITVCLFCCTLIPIIYMN